MDLMFMFIPKPMKDTIEKGTIKITLNSARYSGPRAHSLS